MSDHEAVVRTRAAYEASASAWAARKFDLDHLRPRLDRFAALAGVPAQVLDLGCGPGLHCRALRERGLRVVGLDITRAMLSIAGDQNDSRVDLVQGDSRLLPLCDGAFRGVWANASLLHLPKTQVSGALAEVSRVLRPGGVFLSAMKEGDQDRFDEAAPGAVVEQPRYFAHYRTAEWTLLLEAAGFSVEHQEIDPDSRPGFPDWIVTFALKHA